MRKAVCFVLFAAIFGLSMLLTAPAQDQQDSTSVAARYYLRNRTSNFYQRAQPRRAYRYHVKRTHHAQQAAPVKTDNVKTAKVKKADVK